MAKDTKQQVQEDEEIVALRGRRRWSTEEAHRVLAAWRKSGLSGKAFARQHGLNDVRLSWWRRRLEDWGVQPCRAEAARLSLVPAVVKDGTSGEVVIRLPDGVLVEVVTTATVPARWVSRLVVGLRANRS